jgi:ubiquinone/menaquinone biosynthesis C-methylase UbiE
MSNSVTRFSSRIANYVKFRPGYPAEVLELLRSECNLTIHSRIADIGSGTGKLAEIFLRNGNEVIGVEPNQGMRAEAETLLKNFPGFSSVDGSAENTTLDPGSVDLVTAGQAFHWFDQPRARVEFKRILKPQGWVVLVWNERRLDSTPFLRAYEDLLLRYGTDYQQMRHENTTERIDDFFVPEPVRVATFDNLQEFDFEGLKGRLLSSSYAPEPGHPKFAEMLSALREVFVRQATQGKVSFEYNTRVYYGRLAELEG